MLPQILPLAGVAERHEGQVDEPGLAGPREQVVRAQCDVWGYAPSEMPQRAERLWLYAACSQKLAGLSGHWKPLDESDVPGISQDAAIRVARLIAGRILDYGPDDAAGFLEIRVDWKNVCRRLWAG